MGTGVGSSMWVREIPCISTVHFFPLPRQTSSPQFEIRAVAVEASRQQERRAAQQRCETEPLVNGVFAGRQAFAALIVRVMEQCGLFLGGNQRGQFDSEEPQRQPAVVERLPTLAQRVFQLALAVDRRSKRSSATVALVIAITNDDLETARGLVVKTHPGGGALYQIIEHGSQEGPVADRRREAGAATHGLLRLARFDDAAVDAVRLLVQPRS